jgi:DnaJ-class molecular chaperone
MIISKPKALDAAQALGLELDELTDSKLKKAYRDAAKSCHPDQHGSDKLSEWARISWANDCLKHWLKHAAPKPTESPTGKEVMNPDACRSCDGSGRINVRQRGFGKPLTMQCVMCEGEGVLLPKEIDGD